MKDIDRIARERAAQAQIDALDSERRARQQRERERTSKLAAYRAAKEEAVAVLGATDDSLIRLIAFTERGRFRRREVQRGGWKIGTMPVIVRGDEVGRVGVYLLPDGRVVQGSLLMRLDGAETGAEREEPMIPHYLPMLEKIIGRDSP